MRRWPSPARARSRRRRRPWTACTRSRTPAFRLVVSKETAMREIRYLEALSEALREEMRRDPKVIVLGEDVRVSMRGVTKGLLQEFGPDRIYDTPISEAGFTGLATGAAIPGLRRGLPGQHSDHPYPLLVHMGMKAVMPSTPRDAKGLLKTAIREDDPVVVFAPAALLAMKGPVPEEEVTIPLARPDVRVPFSPPLESYVLPSRDRLLMEARALLAKV